MSPRPGLTRQSVIDAAEQLADAEGWQAVSIQALARRLGIKAPSLYNHVSGLAEIQRELHLRGLRSLAEALRRAAEQEGDPLATFAFALRRFAREHPARYAAAQPSVSLPSTEPELAAAGREALEPLLATMAARGLHGDDAIHATCTIRAAVHGFIDLEQRGAWGMATNADESFAFLVERTLAGLGGQFRARPGGRAAR